MMFRQSMDKKVVITGIGLITPIGIGKDEAWDNALKGKSGIKKLNRFDTSNFPTSLGAEVTSFNPESFIKKTNIMNIDITSQFAIAASILALKDGNLNINKKNRDNIGVVIGTTLGTISFILNQQMILTKKSYLDVHRHLAHMALHNCLSSDISVELGIRGVSETVSSACISGISAIDLAIKKIKYDNYEAIFVGGAESAFSPLPYAGLNIIKALTNDKIRPFDERADGTVLGEGAAVILIEELNNAKKRNAHIYCEICGTEVLCEGYNHFERDKWAKTGVMTIDNAIKKSHISRQNIDFINAHGMGILDFDSFESIILRKYFGKFLNHIPVASIKPLIGHPLAAASAMQVAFTALSIENGIIPHTLNTEKLLRNSNLNLITKVPLKREIKTALINGYAFGGKCAACILRKYDK